MSTEICNLCEHIASNADSEATETYGIVWICGMTLYRGNHLEIAQDMGGRIFILTPSDCPLKKSKTPNNYGTFLEEEA